MITLLSMLFHVAHLGVGKVIRVLDSTGTGILEQTTETRQIGEKTNPVF